MPVKAAPQGQADVMQSTLWVGRGAIRMARPPSMGRPTPAALGKVSHPLGNPHRSSNERPTNPDTFIGTCSATILADTNDTREPIGTDRPNFPN